MKISPFVRHLTVTTPPTMAAATMRQLCWAIASVDAKF